MAPAAAKKKSPTDAAGDRELLVRAQAELLSLRRIAECKAVEAVEARQQAWCCRQRAETAEAVLEQARNDLADIKADMGRQHVMLQEQLSQQVARLEWQLAEVQAQLAAEQQAAAAKDVQLRQLLQDRAQQEDAWQAKSDALHARFDAMLRAALAQMHAGLEDKLSQACCTES